MITMIELKLSEGQTGYNAVGEYARRYWHNNIVEPVLISIAISNDGKSYERSTRVAFPTGYDDIEFMYDWWEGEKYIKIFGIKGLSEIDVDGGIY